MATPIRTRPKVTLPASEIVEGQRIVVLINRRRREGVARCEVMTSKTINYPTGDSRVEYRFEPLTEDSPANGTVVGPYVTPSEAMPYSPDGRKLDPESKIGWLLWCPDSHPGSLWSHGCLA